MKVQTILVQYGYRERYNQANFNLNAVFTQSNDEFQQEMDMMQVRSGNRDIFVNFGLTGGICY